MSSLSEYQNLRRVLQESLDVIDKELAKEGFPDYQITKAEFHPTDNPNYIPSQELFEARRNAIGSLEMLHACLESPVDCINQLGFSHWTEVAMQFASRTKVIGYIIEAGEGGISTKELGEMLAMDAVKIGKLLRLMASYYCLVEVREDHFRITRRGLLLAPDSPIRAFVGWHSWFSFIFSEKVLETWTNKETARSWSTLDTPSSVAFGFREKGYEKVWDWARKEHPQELEQFAFAMHSIPITSLTEEYDWSEYPSDSLIVDVGGGSGHVPITILTKYPQFRAIIQDLPELRETAIESIAKRLPAEMIHSKRIYFQTYDYFTPQPVKNADAYIFGFVIHNLNDESAEIVLKNTRDAMGPKSTIIICSFVVSPAVIADSEGAKETDEDRKLPHPLLHTSLSPRLVLQVDLEMAGSLAGTDRTRKQARELFEQVGLKIKRCIHTRSPLDIYELVLP